MGLDQLNSWSLLWMGYDTAVPASGFAIRQIGTAFAIFAGLAILMTVSFMAAETLTRRAFPHHIQFWKVWSVPVSATKTVLGRTVSGYLLVSLFFAYEIVLYFFAQRKLGWWTPSDTLVNPNLFANYVPSLSAIAMAAQAGFWEESLFPRSPACNGSADRRQVRQAPHVSGRRNDFASAHLCIRSRRLREPAGLCPGCGADHSVIRVRRLIPCFRLLPGIVLHFAYDATWMALPLFVSSTGRARVEQLIVIVAVLVSPLGRVPRTSARRTVDRDTGGRSERRMEAAGGPGSATAGSFCPARGGHKPPLIAGAACCRPHRTRHLGFHDKFSDRCAAHLL